MVEESDNSLMRVIPNFLTTLMDGYCAVLTVVIWTLRQVYPRAQFECYAHCCVYTSLYSGWLMVGS